MPRLFVAVRPPDDVLDGVADLSRPVVEGLRWTTRPQWHVTLRFLGRVDDAADARSALADLRAAAGEAVLGPATGRFGRRVLHVPVAGLDDLAAAVVAATATVGEPPDDRPFSGHLTLARAAGKGAVDLHLLTGAPVAGRWPVHELCLMESRLSPTGATYSIVRRYPLSELGCDLGQVVDE